MALGAGVTAAATLPGTRVVLVPVTAEHVPELRRILATPKVRARWRYEDASPRWPFDDLSAARFAVLLEGAVRGMVQYGEEDEPGYRHASIDVFLDPAVHDAVSAETPSPRWPATWCTTGATTVW